jgi:SWI/SNF-related matrix-associated actin-dependent regulator of chromatin subfamily A3
MKVRLHHGQGRQPDAEQLLDYDIVLTTYATVSAENRQGSSPLQQIEWFRVVLDEGMSLPLRELIATDQDKAHFIRNPSTKQFQGVCALKAQRRWCLSGTPVQNSLEDLGSLMQFLWVPFLDRKADFHRSIIAPLMTGKPEYILNLRLLLDAMCLRRMMSLLNLPKTHYQTQHVTQSPEEKALYAEILQNSRKEINLAVSSNNSITAYGSILRTILRTRMLCDHGRFLKTANKSRPASPFLDNRDTLAELQEGDSGNAYKFLLLYSISTLTLTRYT